MHRRQWSNGSSRLAIARIAYSKFGILKTLPARPPWDQGGYELQLQPQWQWQQGPCAVYPERKLTKSPWRPEDHWVKAFEDPDKAKGELELR
jgi:hypothetical protein